MRHLFGHGWEIVPAGGATGEAFFASHQEKKLFLKRNSSPFLAVLSAEGIVPKLIWTKRLENGDVITAQQCLNGRVLEPDEMAHEHAAKLLHKIHTSKPLLSMLERLGKSPYTPERMLDKIERKLDAELLAKDIVHESVRFLKQCLEHVHFKDYAVCHGDVNHNNWLLADDGELFLIDWDGAMIADPAFDIGMLLHMYIPEKDWTTWLHQYGLERTEHLEMRMKWYVAAQILLAIQWHWEKARFAEMERFLQFLENMHRTC